MFHWIKGRVTRQAHVDVPEGTFEDEHGRQGFFGRVSHLYRLHPPVEIARIEGPLRPRAFRVARAPAPDADDPRGLPVCLAGNDEASLWVSRRREPMPFCFRNAEGDELRFVHRGRGRLETDYGGLDYEPGDYLLIPKGTTYRVVPQGDGPQVTLILETRGELTVPDRGLLGKHVPFDPAVVVTPEPEALPDGGREWEVRIKARGGLTSVFYHFNPLDVVGWKGELSVLKLNTRDLRPVLSDRAHVPPSANCTFVAPGVMVNTFVPRPLEDANVLRVPFYHNNIDYDEVFFFHEGDFRHQSLEPGALVVQPAGIHHGPSRRELEESRKLPPIRIEAVRVNLDFERPLTVTREAEAAEIADYLERRYPAPALAERR
jgi:homogentisate 1,2-dioxygenase